jgi:heat shock protein HslJ
MFYLNRLIVVALTVITLAGCTTTATSPSAMTPLSSSYVAAQLEGTWILSSIQPTGAGRQERPSSATYTLTFGGNGRLSTRADCNTCAASFSVDGSTVTTSENLACTRAACPTMTFESAYTSLLGGPSQAVVTNSTLTLSSARGAMWLVRQD